MNLLVDQMVQLEYIHIADGHMVIEGIAGLAVKQLYLTGFRQIGKPEQVEQMQKALED